MATRTLAEYLELPYTIEVIKNEDGFFARVEELSGRMTWTDRIEDLWPMVEEAKRAWIEDALEDGEPMPEPRPVGDAVERMVVQLPEHLHRKLRRRATQGGLTLDRLVTAALAEAVGE